MKLKCKRIRNNLTSIGINITNNKSIIQYSNLGTETYHTSKKKNQQINTAKPRKHIIYKAINKIFDKFNTSS